MQDPKTGHMRPMTQEEIDRHLLTPEAKTRSRCVLTVGQEVELEGGLFKVVSIGKKRVVLEGLPGTDAISFGVKCPTPLKTQ